MQDAAPGGDAAPFVWRRKKVPVAVAHQVCVKGGQEPDDLTGRPPHGTPKRPGGSIRETHGRELAGHRLEPDPDLAKGEPCPPGEVPFGRWAESAQVPARQLGQRRLAIMRSSLT